MMEQNSFIIYNSKPGLDHINSNISYIKSTNAYGFENLFGFIFDYDIVNVFSNICDFIFFSFKLR